MMQKIEKIIFGPHSRALLPLWSSYRSRDFQNRRLTVLPWPSSGEDSVLPLQGAWVQSVVRELRSGMPHGVEKFINKKKNNGVIQVQVYKNGVNRPLRIWSQTPLCTTSNLNLL